MAPPRGGGGGRAGRPSSSILEVLKATQIVEAKPVLPAEILAHILDYLPVADQMRFARVSRRLCEMVYDDSRWVARLQSMGCWSEAAARRRFEDALARRRREAAAAAEASAAAAAAARAPGGGGGLVVGAHGVAAAAGAAAAGGARQVSSGSTTLFDASEEEQRRRIHQQTQQQTQQQLPLRDGFETLSLNGRPPAAPAAAAPNPMQDAEALLNVLQAVQSVRGHARQEYGKVYGALAPFYWDLQRAQSHADPVVFKVFRDPERQARMLANLRRFAQSDWAQGWRPRGEKLAAMAHLFESAVLREFEQGYEFWDVDGRMRQYAHVLDVLSGSTAAVDLFLQKHPLLDDREVAACNAMDCLQGAGSGRETSLSLGPSRAFFALLTRKLNEQSGVVARIFPHPGRVFWALVDKVREEVVMEYITPLLDEAHERSLPVYLAAVSGLFEQCLQFLRDLEPPRPADEAASAAAAAARGEDAAKKPERARAASRVEKRASMRLGGGPAGDEDAAADADAGDDDDDDDSAWRPRARLRKVRELAFRTLEPHLDLYLQEELDHFTKHAEAAVREWDKKLSEQDAHAESFYMAHFNRQAVKTDFLSSFKKVVMMPVTVLPSLPGLGGGGGGGSSSTKPSTAATPDVSRAATPTPPGGPGGPGSSSSGLPDKAPDDELAAKAALMASRLEGIRSLFSLEVALNLVHAAKASLGRAAVFVALGGQAAGEAREQCEAIFVVLLRVLGNGHVKPGFDRAVEHLSQYNPRAVHRGGATEREDSAGDGGVAPLMTFIELVNVGDLISQMIDVFYEQQLAGPQIADRNDFLDPAGLAKKRFEQMIDESVAAGLNKGIDVLMDEVEYICATTQKPTDYFPEAAETSSGVPADAADPAAAAAASASASASASPPPASFSPSSSSTAVADLGPTATAQRVVALVRGHTSMLQGSTEKTMLDVFNGEVGLRLFTAVCKHLKRQRISTGGAVHVIADMALYFDYVRTLRNPDLLAYFRALRALSQLYLIDARRHAKEMAVIIADSDRFGGVFRAEEVYEFAERRADWYQVKRDVERAMYGLECGVM